MTRLRGQLFTVLTGQAADVSGQAGGDVPGMLLAIGGPSTRTRSGIDLTKAAASLGVSRRTAERWVRTARTGTGQRPSPAHARAIARQAATTKAGRRAALTTSTVGRALASHGARLSITAQQGPRAAGRDYMCARTTQLHLDPADAEAEAEAMLNARENGGEKGFMSWATNHWGQEYLDDWQFGAIDVVDVEQPTGRGWR